MELIKEIEEAQKNHPEMAELLEKVKPYIESPFTEFCRQEAVYQLENKGFKDPSKDAVEIIALSLQSNEQFASGEVSGQIVDEYISECFKTITLDIKEIHRRVFFKTDEKHYDEMEAKVHELYDLYRNSEDSTYDAMDKLIDKIEEGEFPIWYKNNTSYVYEENGILYGGIIDICKHIADHLVKKGSNVIESDDLSNFCDYDFAVWAKHNPDWYGIKSVCNKFNESKLSIVADSYSEIKSRIPSYGTIVQGASYGDAVQIIQFVICECLNVSRYTDAKFMLKKAN